MCTSIRQIKPLSTTTTIHNMFSVRKQVTVCIIATVFIQIICAISPVLANSQPLSLIGDEPTQSQEPISALPPQAPIPRARPQPRRPGFKRPPRRPGGLRQGLTNIACLGSDIGVNEKLKNKDYMEQQLHCVLDKGPCDDTGRMIKRLAPDVLKGHCPHPCNICTRRQIKRVMAEVQRNFPGQFSQMLRSFSRRS